MINPHGHKPVLLAQVLELLQPGPGETVADLTVGRAGHSEELGRDLGPDGRLVVFDLDDGNINDARDRLDALPCPVHAYAESFVHAPRRLVELGLPADVVLADLGFSSTQMDDPARGLSFMAEGPLDMRLDRRAPTTAADLLATLPEADLADLIFQYGEEPLSRKIARKLAQTQRHDPILTTTRLAELVVEAYGARARQSRMHPATRTFMALRIAVNGELDALNGLLEAVARAATGSGTDAWLARGARVGIISFHSLEDRLVKRAFAELARRGAATVLTKKPVTADDSEIAANPRARSAKLRVVRIDGHAHGG